VHILHISVGLSVRHIVSYVKKTERIELPFGRVVALGRYTDMLLL